MIACYSDSSITWLSRQQPFVALSTAKAEYMALTSGLQEEPATKRSILQLPSTAPDQSNLMLPYVDNHLAVDMLFPLDGTKPLRFIDARHFAVCDIITRSRFTITHIESTLQRTDVLTSRYLEPLFGVSNHS